MNWEGIDPSILGPAFLAGLIVVSTHIPLGRHVLKRGIIFLDLAVAQFAGLGLIAAYSLEWQPGGWQMQAIAAAAAIAGALLLGFTERHWPSIQEALIGSLFVIASSVGVLLLASNPHGGEHLRDLLVGQILWVNYAQLQPVALLFAAVLTLWFTLGRRLPPLFFYLLFAVSVTASVQLVGVYLVFASLIMPALAVRNRGVSGLWIGYLVGLLGYATGLAASALADLPAGAMIVCTLALTSLLTAWILNRGKA